VTASKPWHLGTQTVSATIHLMIFLLWRFKCYANLLLSTREFYGTRQRFGNFSRIKELVMIWRLCKITKIYYQLCHASPSVRLTLTPHETPRLQLHGVSWNFIFDCFSTLCSEYASSINIWQEHRVLYMKTFVYLWSYLARLFLELEIFDKYYRKIANTFYFQ
jgi:hypothetical protein